MKGCSCSIIGSPNPVGGIDTIRKIFKYSTCCFECGAEIAPGIPHLAAPHRGGIVHLCLDCNSVVEYVFCGGPPIGTLWAQVHDHIHSGEPLDASCIPLLTEKARERVCNMIQTYWDEGDEDDCIEDS